MLYWLCSLGLSTGQGGGRAQELLQVQEKTEQEEDEDPHFLQQRWKQCAFLPAVGTDHGGGGGKILAIGSSAATGGEEELFLLDSNASDAAASSRQLTNDGCCQRQHMAVAPSGSHVAVVDSDRQLSLITMVTGQSELLHTAVHYGTEHAELSWSPDSRWLAFVTAAANTFDQIMLWGPMSSNDDHDDDDDDDPSPRLHSLTSDRSQSSSPTWSMDGNWLYFLSDRNLVNLTGSPWGARAPEPMLSGRSTNVFALALDVGLRAPWAEDDETMPMVGGSAAVEVQENQEEDHREKQAKKPQVKMSGGIAATQTRLHQLPIPAASFDTVTAVGTTLFLHSGGAVSRVDLRHPAKNFAPQPLLAGAFLGNAITFIVSDGNYMP